MATLVIATPNRSLTSEVQVGPADIVAAVTAAHGIWGWFGGLRGLKGILALISAPSAQKRMSDIFKAVDQRLEYCHILCQGGLKQAPIPESADFGQSNSEKLVGLTLCALAHVMNPPSALNVFMTYFADPLLSADSAQRDWPGVKEALRTFLFDRLAVILNEGAVRGLSEIFDRSIELNELQAVTFSFTAEAKLKDPLVAGEMPFVEGFLTWLISNKINPYHSRSALVAKLATTLRCVGYNINRVSKWNGCGPKPDVSRSLILVTGGVSETDPLAPEFQGKSIAIQQISHYRYNTVGALLWNAFVTQSCQIHVELLQQNFEDINKHISSHLSVQWTYGSHSDGSLGEEIQARAHWLYATARQNRIATRLATFLFPQIVDEVAACYQSIANEENLTIIKEWSQATQIAPFPKQMQHFLSISLSICFSILAKFCTKDFWRTQHVTTVHMNSMAHLRWLCVEVSWLLAGRCPMSRIVDAIAVIHCAVEIPEQNEPLDPQAQYPSEEYQEAVVVGQRQGRYAVLPNLLFNLSKPIDETIFELHCVDKFIANLPNQKDGYLQSTIGLPSALSFSDEILRQVTDSTHPDGSDSHSILNQSRYTPVVLGPPQPSEPDRSLYLSLERSPEETQLGEPHLSLCGRLDGERLGHVSVQDILCCLALSWSKDAGLPYDYSKVQSHDKCVCHTSTATTTFPAETVYNISVGSYFQEPGIYPSSKPDASPRYPVYVQVVGNTPWALFMAGLDKFHNRVCFSCVQCSANTSSNYISSSSGGLKTLIAYHGHIL